MRANVRSPSPKFSTAMANLVDQAQHLATNLEQTAAGNSSRDPREDVPPPIFKKGVLQIEDISPGMELKGTVLNVVPFGGKSGGQPFHSTKPSGVLSIKPANLLCGESALYAAVLPNPLAWSANTACPKGI